MTFRDYIRVLRERWRLILSVVLVALAIGVTATELTQKVYAASAQIFVQPNADSANQSQFQGAVFAQAQVATYADIVDSTSILEKVSGSLNNQFTARELRSKISASAPAGRTLIDITATDSDATTAATIANETAQAAVSAIERYSQSKDRDGNLGDPAVTLTLTQPAEAPSSPDSPDAVLNIAVALIVGMLVGISAAVLREALDNRIKTEDRLAEVVGAPVMGAIIDDPRTSEFPIASRAGTPNVRAENFRQMRANLQFANVDVHPRVLAVTSSIPGEGKTTVSINLAATLSESGFRVCLVDADLRRPTVATLLGLVGPVGLTSVLIQQIGLEEAIQPVTNSLSVLAAGAIPPNPSEVLSSSYVRSVIRSLLNSFDYVILDTAPLLPVADGAEVAALADGTLLVAQQMKTTDAQVKRAASALRRVDASLVGVVLNRVRRSRTNPYSYSYYRYDREPDQKPRPRPAKELVNAVEKTDHPMSDKVGRDG